MLFNPLSKLSAGENEGLGLFVRCIGVTILRAGVGRIVIVRSGVPLLSSSIVITSLRRPLAGDLVKSIGV